MKNIFIYLGKVIEFDIYDGRKNIYKMKKIS